MTKHPEDKAAGKFTGGKALELVGYQPGADPGGNLLAAGDFFYGCNRFQVAP